MSQQKKKKVGPERITYHHNLTLKAGHKFMTTVIEESFSEDVREPWIKEWLRDAKSKKSINPIDFISEKANIDAAKVLAWGSRHSGIPIIDCEHVAASNNTHYIIDGLPMTLVSSSEIGAITIVHSCPFLETFLDTKLIADIYGAIKVNFALAHPDNYLRHIEKLYTSGRVKHRLLVRAEEDLKNPSFPNQVAMLEGLGLVKKGFSRESTREEVLEELEENRPEQGASAETEWYALTSNIPFVQLAPLPSNKELLEILLPTTQKTHGIIPVCEYGGTLTIAAKRILRGSKRQEVMAELQKNCKINSILSSPGTINEIITANMSTSISTTSMARDIKLESTPEEEEIETVDIQELASGEDATVIKLVQTILIGAVNKKATDIHIAAHPDNTWVRYRVDGNMVEAPFHLPFQFWKATISRIKIMSGIDIKYSPVPQDGKFPLAVGSDEFDIRVNVCPTIYGEKAILRVQRKEETVPTLEGLGFQQHEKKLITNLVESDHGLLIICGPTGSGKCLSKGTKVMKFNGELIPVEEIQPGDLLMGPDSKPRRVLKTNIGFGPMYEIQPKKGEPWGCNDAHILTLKHTAPNMTKPSILGDRRKRNSGIYQAFGYIPKNQSTTRLDNEHPEIVDVCLKDFLDRTPKGKNPDQNWKLFRVGVDFSTPKEIKEIPKDYFYYLGLWIGDGTTKANEITNTDKEIISWVKKFAGTTNSKFSLEEDKRAPHIKTISSKPYSKGKKMKRDRNFPFVYTVDGKKDVCLRTMLASCISQPQGKRRPTLKASTGEKTIPLWAKTSTSDQRLALLAGVLDTDGHLKDNCFDFVNKQKSVVEGIAFIARSLNLWSSTPKEKIVAGKRYWRTCISGETNKIPTLIKHKKASTRKQKKDVLKTGWNAISKGNGSYYGFTLNGDGRFLLEDFTVTHNTTTLSAVMYSIDRKRWNVITAENPVEIRIPHVEQTPIDGSQMTFGKFVPAALRQDPDYIMIGETRDRETTEEVIRAAITGHIVMTTLHTNSAAGAPARLIDMGAQPFLITDALKAVCAQRLIRRLCTNCARPARRLPTKEEMIAHSIKPEWFENCDYIMEPVGCKMCNNTGYRGRIAIIEGFSTSPEIRRIIIHENADTELIREEIVKQGGKTLYQHAMENVAKQITSITEALTVRNLD